MRRLLSLFLLVPVAIVIIASSATAFPIGNVTLRQDWARVISHWSPNFGIIQPGECILVRQEFIDATNRVHLRLIRVCD